jgi:AraC-like DNA-binding protein
VVLPEPLRLAAARHPLLRGLYVTDTGYFPRAGGHFIERTKGAPTHLLIVCLRGAGWVKLGLETRALRAGGFAWLAASRAHAYGADMDDPWTIAWAHFTGEEAAAWRRLLRADATPDGITGALPLDRLDEVGLDRVHAALERGCAVRDQVEAAAALRVALGAITRLEMATAGARSAHERVVASAESLQRDWMRPRRLDELAAAAGLSTAHYSSLFRKHTGFAPIDFLIRLRVRHACRLLDTTTLAVARIAAEVGYDDPYYFTRCFRRVMGCSPREYRKVPKG